MSDSEDHRPAIRGGFVIKKRNGLWGVFRADVVQEWFTHRKDAIDYAERRSTRELEGRSG